MTAARRSGAASTLLRFGAGEAAIVAMICKTLLRIVGKTVRGTGRAFSVGFGLLPLLRHFLLVGDLLRDDDVADFAEGVELVAGFAHHVVYFDDAGEVEERRGAAGCLVHAVAVAPGEVEDDAACLGDLDLVRIGRGDRVGFRNLHR